jgi:hypothetical protein
MQLALSQRRLDEGASPSFCAGRKRGDVAQALLWHVLSADPSRPSRVLLDQVAHRPRPMAVRMRHRNRWRAIGGLNRAKGRPQQATGHQPVASGAAVVQVTPHLSFVGVPLCAHGLDHQEAFGPVMAQLQQAIEAYTLTHPDDDVALVPHREPTLLRRCQALFFAPWLGIDRLTGFDTPEHPLPTRLGWGSQSATRRQLLGQRERVGAAEALLPTLGADKTGQLASVDGPLIASWSRASMPKGKSTMLGRLMAGSPAVITHSDTGHALCVASHPPDMELSHVGVDSGQKVALATGTSLCVIDRAVQAVAIARAFDDQGLGVRCMLDDNEHQGLESFAATLVDTLDDGTKV